MGVFCVPKPLVGGFGCDELVLYGIRELAQQFLGPLLDIEVENSDSRSEEYVKNKFLLCPVLRGLPILVTVTRDLVNLLNTELFPLRETRPASGMFPRRKFPERPSLISTPLIALVGST